MSTHDAIVSCKPTSYWPLDDDSSATTVRDEMGRNAGTVSSSGVQLAAVPFGSALMPLFDGSLGSLITIPHDDRYSHAFANALTVLCWICPS